MTLTVTTTRTAAQWTVDPALRDPEDEFQFARNSWELVCPADGALPEVPSPLQRLLYVRLTASKFMRDLSSAAHS